MVNRPHRHSLEGLIVLYNQVHVRSCVYLGQPVHWKTRGMSPFLFLIQATCTALLVVWAATRGSFKVPPRHIHPYEAELWLETKQFRGSLDLETPVFVEDALQGVREDALRSKRVFSPFKKQRLGLPIAPQLAPPVYVAVPGSVPEFSSNMTTAPFRNGRVLANRTLGECAGQNLTTTPRGIVGRGVYDFILGKCRVGTLDAYFDVSL